MGRDVISTAEAGRVAGVDAATIRYWITHGWRGIKLPALSAGGMYLVRRRDVEHFAALRSGVSHDQIQPA
jgi:hypothetical protein